MPILKLRGYVVHLMDKKNPVELNSLELQYVGTKSQTEFTRAGTLIPFVVRTRSSCRITSRVIVAHLWWLSRGRCSQSQFKQRLRLKWHEGTNEGLIFLWLCMKIAAPEWRSTTTNIYTCTWHNLPPGCTWPHSVCCLSSFICQGRLSIPSIVAMFLLALISYSYPLKKIPLFLFCIEGKGSNMT